MSQNTCSLPSEHLHHLKLENISARYDKSPVLHDINFEISCGHRLAVIGPNGAGKSTLLKVLAGVLKQSTGAVYWQNLPLAKWTHEIAYLPQLDSHQKDFPITVKEVVAMGRYPKVNFWKKFSAEDHAKVEQAMIDMEIKDLEHRQIDDLSGGQQQRTFIARCLAQEAHVILLDEPFNGLDSESRIHLTELMRKLSNRGHLIIASHHNLDTVTQIFDYTLAVNKSQVAFGKSHDIMQLSSVSDLFTCHH